MYKGVYEFFSQSFDLFSWRSRWGSCLQTIFSLKDNHEGKNKIIWCYYYIQNIQENFFWCYACFLYQKFTYFLLRKTFMVALTLTENTEGICQSQTTNRSLASTIFQRFYKPWQTLFLKAHRIVITYSQMHFPFFFHYWVTFTYCVWLSWTSANYSSPKRILDFCLRD